MESSHALPDDAKKDVLDDIAELEAHRDALQKEIAFLKLEIDKYEKVLDKYLETKEIAPTDRPKSKEEAALLVEERVAELKVKRAKREAGEQVKFYSYIEKMEVEHREKLRRINEIQSDREGERRARAEKFRKMRDQQGSA